MTGHDHHPVSTFGQGAPDVVDVHLARAGHGHGFKPFGQRHAEGFGHAGGLQPAVLAAERHDGGMVAIFGRCRLGHLVNHIGVVEVADLDGIHGAFRRADAASLTGHRGNDRLVVGGPEDRAVGAAAVAGQAEGALARVQHRLVGRYGDGAVTQEGTDPDGGIFRIHQGAIAFFYPAAAADHKDAFAVGGNRIPVHIVGLQKPHAPDIDSEHFRQCRVDLVGTDGLLDDDHVRGQLDFALENRIVIGDGKAAPLLDDRRHLIEFDIHGTLVTAFQVEALQPVFGHLQVTGKHIGAGIVNIFDGQHAFQDPFKHQRIAVLGQAQHECYRFPGQYGRVFTKGRFQLALGDHHIGQGQAIGLIQGAGNQFRGHHDGTDGFFDDIVIARQPDPKIAGYAGSTVHAGAGHDLDHLRFVDARHQCIQGSLFFAVKVGDGVCSCHTQAGSLIDQHHLVPAGGNFGSGLHAGHPGTHHQDVGGQVDGFHSCLLCHEVLPRYFITSPAD